MNIQFTSFQIVLIVIATRIFFVPYKSFNFLEGSLPLGFVYCKSVTMNENVVIIDIIKANQISNLVHVEIKAQEYQMWGSNSNTS